MIVNLLFLKINADSTTVQNKTKTTTTRTSYSKDTVENGIDERNSVIKITNLLIIPPIIIRGEEIIFIPIVRTIIIPIIRITEQSGTKTRLLIGEIIDISLNVRRTKGKVVKEQIAEYISIFKGLSIYFPKLIPLVKYGATTPIPNTPVTDKSRDVFLIAKGIVIVSSISAVPSEDKISWRLLIKSPKRKTVIIIPERTTENENPASAAKEKIKSSEMINLGILPNLIILRI